MRFALVLVGWWAFLQIAAARPAQIILLRHAEKPVTKGDPHLSARGDERSRGLVQFLTTNPALLSNGLPAALFAAKPSKHEHSLRPFETLKPLAQDLNLPIHTPFPADDYAALAKDVLASHAYDGKTVVICWVHTYLPELAKKLGVKPKPARWDGDAYDRVWVIRYAGDRVHFSDIPQKVLPGDRVR